jgi:hypothetical protein
MVALRGGDGTHELGEGAVVAGGQWTVVGGGARSRTLVLVDGVRCGLWGLLNRNHIIPQEYSSTGMSFWLVSGSILIPLESTGMTRIQQESVGHD